jgi:succinate dehydrogenase/fumarate reductase flavoprotein subunit
MDHEWMSCDLLVLGAGMAGLTAAGYAAEHGATVIVIEKAKSIGGSALLSGGVLWTATSADRMRLYGGGRPHLGEVVLRNYNVGLAWLRRRGIAMSQAVPVLHGRGYQIDILDHLRGCGHLVEQHGGHVVCDTETHRLLTDANGAVTGARISHANGVIDVHAKATVLATGGYQNSAELRARYIHPNARDKLLLRTNPVSCGDAMRLAGAVGAAATPSTPGFYGHLVSESPEWGDPRLFTMLSQYHSDRSLLLNEDGKRFCDESLGDHTNTIRVLAQKNARAICLWDSNIHEAYAITAIVKGTEALDKMKLAIERGGNGIVALGFDEVGTFASSNGFDGAQLCRSIDEYNAQCRSGWETLLPPRAENFGALEKPLFYALVVRPAITHTHGGLSVDESARVLRPDGAPVRGLFAAGADADGVYGIGYAGGLALALAYGLQAAGSAGFGAASGSSELEDAGSRT